MLITMVYNNEQTGSFPDTEVANRKQGFAVFLNSLVRQLQCLDH